jgi:hypothetical protein
MKTDQAPLGMLPARLYNACAVMAGNISNGGVERDNS